MRVAVIGAGVIGASTALELARDGHQVIVIERHGAPAQGASHANAGLISPGHCYSWAEPGALGTALDTLCGRGEGFGICDPWRPSLWRWGLLFARETTLARWRANSRAAIALAAFSRDLLFRADHPVSARSWAGRQDGVYYFHAGRRNLQEDILLQWSGEPHIHLDHPQALAHDAFFRASALAFARSTFCPTDGTGNAALFTAEALRQAARWGADIRYAATVHGFDLSQQQVRAVRVNADDLAVDAVVIAAGLQSRELFRQLGHSLPIYPVTGYSMTYHDVGLLPPCGGVALQHRIAWAPLEDSSLRLTGFADVGIPRAAIIDQRFAKLHDFALRLHPPLKNHPAERWTGYRPMTPDGLPFLGACAISNVYANCGHGAMGWTMAAACAHLTARLVRKVPAGFDLTPYAVGRFGRLRRNRS